MAVPELAGAASALAEAELTDRPAEKFLLAHLAALRVAAVVLSCRASAGRGPSTRPRDVWQVLAEVAPEYAEWAGFFASSALKRQAVQAGAVAVVSAREADDLVRDVSIFHDQVAGRLARRGQRGSTGERVSTGERGKAGDHDSTRVAPHPVIGEIWTSREFDPLERGVS